MAVVIVMGMGTLAALWGCALALKFRSQSAAPLMQAGMFVLILTTTAYAPLALLTGWLHTVAKYNPATQIVEAARQGFVGGVTWGDTWPGLLALAGLRPCSPRSRCAACAARRFDALIRGVRPVELRRSGASGERCRAARASRVRRRERSWTEGERGRGRHTPTRGRAPSGIRGSGTGTRASRRSCGGASTATARGPSSRASYAPCRPDGFVGHTIFWDHPVSLAAPRLLQRRLDGRRR